MKIAFQMDPISPIDINADSTFRLAEEAQARGHELFYYTPDRLAYDQGRVTAQGWPLSVQRVLGDHFTLGDEQVFDLADMDVVWLRQDPPFDMAYITACHILELLKPDTLVLNDPEHVRSGPEKLYPLLDPQFMPPTLISRDKAAIADFRSDHRDVIVKPLYGFGGGDVFRVKPEDSNFSPLIDLFLGRTREPLIVQAFLPAVADGDKRIILIDGEVVGGFNRIPIKGHARSNLAVGGTAEPSDLSEADLAICAAIGPDLKARGQVLVGLDVIGGRLTEVNNTSPTGVQQVRDFTGRDPAAMFWDVVQDKLANQ